MTILQDVRFVNASSGGNDSYLYEYWIMLPAWKLAVRITKVDGWAPEDYSSRVYSEPNGYMPQEVQDWFRGTQGDE